MIVQHVPSVVGHAVDAGAAARSDIGLEVRVGVQCTVGVLEMNMRVRSTVGVLEVCMIMSVKMCVDVAVGRRTTVRHKVDSDGAGVRIFIGNRCTGATCVHILVRVGRRPAGAGVPTRRRV